MKSKTIWVVSATLLGWAVAAGANPPDSGEHCRLIVARAAVEEFQQPCLEDPSFLGCYVQRIRGTFSGTWLSLFNEGWNADLRALGLPIPDDSPASIWARETEVFISDRGTIFGDAQWVLDLRILPTGGLTLTTVVTGGTGIYEDASGWIVQTAVDDTTERFSVRGRVCGPYIPRRGHK